MRVMLLLMRCPAETVFSALREPACMGLERSKEYLLGVRSFFIPHGDNLELALKSSFTER